MSEVFVFLLVVIVLLAIYGIAESRSQKDPLLGRFTDHESDGSVLKVAEAITDDTAQVAQNSFCALLIFASKPASEASCPSPLPNNSKNSAPAA